MKSSSSAQPPAFHSGRLGSGAHASMVNRTRRVVREQALAMRAQKQRSRSLWLPVTICSTLLLITCYAGWAVLDGYDPVPNGAPDASDQVLVVLAWSLPVTILVLGLVWFHRRNHSTGEVS